MMRWIIRNAAPASLALFIAVCGTGQSGPQRRTSGALRASTGAAAFEAIVPVLHNPRCMNCHSTRDFPRQGNDSHPHTMEVRRGPDGHGVNSVQCSACHQDHNLPGVHMPPGAPEWALPPPQTPMIWEGLTDHALCELLKNPAQNGHRTVQQIVEHMSTPLVLWAWHPGEGRTPVRVPFARFITNVKAWAASGAVCPSESQPGSTPAR